MTGRVPDAEELQHAAARASEATLSWPAPPDRRDAIDALEHDLATLRSLAGDAGRSRARPRAIHPAAEREPAAIGARPLHARQESRGRDGTASSRRPTASRRFSRAHRLGARRYSLSALQKYANCPYQFLLSTIHRLRPAEDLEPLHRMDPLTRGSLFHEMQTAFYRRLQRDGALPVHAGRPRHARSRCSTRS
mgnify:CR=1 FL=1